MADASGVDGIDLYADVEDFNEELDASGPGNPDGSKPAGGGPEGGSSANAAGDDLYDDVLSAGAPSDAVKGEKSPSGEDGGRSSSEPRYPGRKYQVYVGNLTWWTTDQDIQDAVQAVGIADFLEVKFYENRINGQSKGFCCVSLGSEPSTRLIIEKLPKRELHGQAPVVTYATKQALYQFESQSKTRPVPGPPPPAQNGRDRDFPPRGESGHRGPPPPSHHHGPPPPSRGYPGRGPPPMDRNPPPPQYHRGPPPPPPVHHGGPPPPHHHPHPHQMPPGPPPGPPMHRPPMHMPPAAPMPGPPMHQPLPPHHAGPPPMHMVPGPPPGPPMHVPRVAPAPPPVMHHHPHHPPGPPAPPALPPGAHVNPSFFPPGGGPPPPGAAGGYPPPGAPGPAPGPPPIHHGLSEPEFDEIMSRNRDDTQRCIDINCTVLQFEVFRTHHSNFLSSKLSTRTTLNKWQNKCG